MTTPSRADRAEAIREYPPGSEEARARNCACPVLDNAHGKGRYCDGSKYGWFISERCPLHGGTRS